MEAGTGKTPVIIEIMKNLYFRGKVNRVVIFAPNSILINWELEIKAWMQCSPHFYKMVNLNNVSVAESNSKLAMLSKYHDEFKTLVELKESYSDKSIKKADRYKYEKKQPKKLLIVIVNYDKATLIEKALKKFKPQMWVNDESHNLKNKNSKQTKAITKLMENCEYRYNLTGTPIIQGVQDLFSQYHMLGIDDLGKKWTDFKEKYLVYGGFSNKQVVGVKNKGRIKRILRRTMYRVRLSDVVNLPNLNIRSHMVELESDAMRYYKEVEEEMTTLIKREPQLSRRNLRKLLSEAGVDFEPGESMESMIYKAEPFLNGVTCDAVVVQLIRLQQIAGGFITLDSGEILQVSDRKINATIAELSLRKSPTVIFCRFIPEIYALEEALKKLRMKVGVMRGEESSKIYKDFRKGVYDIIICQIQSGSVGLNLQRADGIIFYSWDYSAGNYTQAIARIRRKGQLNEMNIIHIKAQDTVDEKILVSVDKKINISTNILDT